MTSREGEVTQQTMAPPPDRTQAPLLKSLQATRRACPRQEAQTPPGPDATPPVHQADIIFCIDVTGF